MEKYLSIPTKYSDILMIIFSIAILYLVLQVEADNFHLNKINIALASINVVWQIIRFFKNKNI